MAANVGFDAKFQLFKIDELFSKEILDKSKLHRQRKNWELPLEFIDKLSALSRSLGLKFGCTPFYLGQFMNLSLMWTFTRYHLRRFCG